MKFLRPILSAIVFVVLAGAKALHAQSTSEIASKIETFASKYPVEKIKGDLC